MLKRLLPSVLICSSIILGTAGAKPDDNNEASTASASGRSGYGQGLAHAASEIVEYPAGYDPDPGRYIYYPTSADIIKPLSYAGEGTYNFYDILNTREKVAYLYIEAALKKSVKTSVISMGNLTDVDEVRRAYCAFTVDHPEYFWLFGIQIETYTDTETDEVVEMNLVLGCCSGQSFKDAPENYKKVNDKVNDIVREANEKCSSDYEKVRYFAEYLCNNIEYNHDVEDPYYDPSEEDHGNSFNAYGGLIDGSGGCEAYAESFKMLCDAAKIPCVSMFSDEHEWNAVKLGGEWYHVDVTWMDTSDAPMDYKWFAVGAEYMDEYDRRYAHETTPDIILDNYNPDFTYPDISEKNYKPGGIIPGDLNNDKKVNNKDIVLLRYYINNFDDVSITPEVREAADLNDDSLTDDDDLDILREQVISLT